MLHALYGFICGLPIADCQYRARAMSVTGGALIETTK